MFNIYRTFIALIFVPLLSLDLSNAADLAAAGSELLVRQANISELPITFSCEALAIPGSARFIGRTTHITAVIATALMAVGLIAHVGRAQGLDTSQMLPPSLTSSSKNYAASMVEDLKDIPADLRSEYFASFNRAYASADTELRKYPERLEASKEYQAIMLPIVERLMQRGYFIGIERDNQDPRQTLHAGILQINPTPQSNRLGNQSIHVFHVIGVSGYLPAVEGYYGLTFQCPASTVFIFDKEIHEMSEQFILFRHTRKWTVGQSTAFSGFIDFDDPVAREEMLKAFRNVPDNKIEFTLQEEVILHEKFHSWAISHGEGLGEIVPRLGVLALSKAPLYQLQQLVGLINAAGENGVVYDPHNFEKIISEIARNLFFRHLLTLKERNLADDNPEAFISLLREKRIPARKLRGAAKEYFKTDYGRLPSHRLIAAAT